MAVKGLIKKGLCCAVYQDVKKEEQQRTEQEDDRFSSAEKHYTILSGKHEAGMSTQQLSQIRAMREELYLSHCILVYRAGYSYIVSSRYVLLPLLKCRIHILCESITGYTFRQLPPLGGRRGAD